MLDLRQAIRGFRATPVVSAVAVLSLALGIGATTAIFSLVNALLLRPLAVADPGKLATVSSDWAIGLGFKSGAGFSYGQWERFRDRAGLFDDAFLCRPVRFSLGRGGEQQSVEGYYASGRFFSTLGVKAIQGRVFTADDDVRGGGPAGPVAVISHGLWQRRFGGAPGAIGSSLVIEGVPFTIVGVTPPSFAGLEVGQPFDIVLPLETEPLLRGANSAILQRGAFIFFVIVRLKAEQSAAAGTAAIRALQSEIVGSAAPAFAREPFTLAPAAEGTSGAGSSGAAGLRQRYTRPLLTILTIVVLVLLVACVNIANLLLARATARRHDLGVRRALGASRWRLARELLVESALVSVVGTAVGLLVARWGARVLVAQLSTSVGRVVLDTSLDWRVAAFSFAIMTVTALLFGVAPALRASRADVMDVLKAEGRRTSSGASARFSGSLVVVQVALSLVLVLTAGLLVRTFVRLATVPLGFDSGRVLTIAVDTIHAQVDATGRLPLYGRLTEALRAVPGVERAAASLWVPLGGGGAYMGVDVPGGTQPSQRRVVVNVVTPGWLATYGTPLRDGRDFEESDTATAPPVALVNEAFIRHFMSGRRAVGETLSFGQNGPARTIVGVAGDAAFRSGNMVPGAASLALRDPVPPMVYVPLPQSKGLGPVGATTVQLSVRSAAGDPAALAPSVGAALSAVDKDFAYTFRPLDDLVSAALAQERLAAMVAGFFGLLGTLLAALGLYGVTSYTVNLRRTEIGIRLALGAAPGGVVRLVLSRVALMVGAGIIAGAALGIWTLRFIRTLLFGLEPRDPATLAAAIGLLAAVGILAGWLPARRASRIDPAIVLRGE